MLNYDDLLQKKLDDLESGAPLETVLQDLPEEAKELEALIRLAAAVRNTPHPEPAAGQVQAQRQEVMAAAVRNTQPINKNGVLPARNTQPINRDPRPVDPTIHVSGRNPRMVDPTIHASGRNPRTVDPTIHVSGRNPRTVGPTIHVSGRNPQAAVQRTFLPRPAWNRVGVGTLLAGAGAMAVIFLLILAGAGFWLSGRDRSAARVENLNGQVQVAANQAGTQWKNVSVGARLHRGDRLRTLGASNATLVFFEGTHTFVSPNSDLSFTELKGASGNTLQVKIAQTAGETWNKVTPFKGNTQSFFLVQTPSGTASVHGTSFNVKVNQTGQAQFAVNTGEVRVQNDGNEVTLQAGQATTANTTGEIAAPTYQFSIQGSLLAMEGPTGLWTVSGVQMEVTDFTAITGFHDAPQFGDTIQVAGRILDDNTWLADTIEPGTGDNQVAYFTGTLEKYAGDTWQVSGMPVKITGETVLDPTLASGAPVKVTYNILEDGTWLALKIESLVEQPEEPTATPTATSDPNAIPSYAFQPEEIETQGCASSDFNLNGSLADTAHDAKDIAANVQLGYLIDRGGEYVSSVELDPSGWESIAPGQAVPFNIHIAMNEKWAALAGKDGEEEDAQVKLRVFIASATNRPDHLNGQLTVTIAAGCNRTPTQAVSGTPTGTPTVTLTGTLTPETTGTLTPEGTGTPTITLTPIVSAPTAAAPEAGQCTGANPHPTGMKLAQRYNVPYEEIMKWFCQHYGFGEIDLAYSLSHQSGKPVDEIFAMRASGMGWGEIKKALLPNNGKDKDNGKGNGKDKNNK